MAGGASARRLARGASIQAEGDADPIDQRAFDFSVAIVELADDLPPEIPEVVFNALVEQGTRVGAEVFEAHYTSSRRAHLSALTSARHAAQRVQYWLQLVAAAAEGVSSETIDELVRTARELRKTLAVMCLKARQGIESADDD